MKSDEVYLRHMLDAAEKALDLSREYSRADLETAELIGLALQRLLEVIGEAANKVSKATQMATPEIPWRQMIATRNRLIHAYFDVDYDILWAIVTGDLPSLVEQLRSMLDETKF
jgi:uncharacterized protein with HEPN domain